MARKYYVRWGRFANCYDLCYAETAKDQALLEGMNFERITRERALILARQERDRRGTSFGSFGGYADTDVMPAAWYIEGMTETQLEDDYKLRNHIWEKKF